MTFEGSSPVAVGIDAAIVADHQVTLRRCEPGGPGEIVERFKVPSTIVGLGRLTEAVVGVSGVDGGVRADVDDLVEHPDRSGACGV